MPGQIASTATSLIGLVLAVRLGLRYVQRPRTHTLLYTISLALFTVAAAADAVVHDFGTVPETLFRLYWFSAAGLVGTMALGTGVLVVPYTDQDLWGRLGRWLTVGTMAILGLLMAWLLVAVLIMPVSAQQLVLTRETLTKVPAGPKFPFIMTNILGTFLIFGGALWSYWKARTGYTLIIAAGALFFAFGGTAANLGGDALFYTSQVLGTLVLYAGVSQSIQPRRVVPRSVRPNA